jgi:hypothetical protein
MDEDSTSEKKQKVLLTGDYKDLDEELKKDIKFMTKLIQLHPKLFTSLFWKLKKEIIEHNPKLILDIQRVDKNVALDLFSTTPKLISLMDMEIFDELIAQDKSVFENFFYNFWRDNFDSKLLEYNPLILSYLKSELLIKVFTFPKLDKELFYKIVEKNPMIFRYVGDEIKKDKRLIIELLQRVPGILKYVDDIEIILSFFNDPTFIQYVERNNVQFSERLINTNIETKLILELVHLVPEQLKYVGDIEIILEIIKDPTFMNDVQLHKVLFPNLSVEKKDKHLLLELLLIVPEQLEYVARHNVEILLELFNEPTFVQIVQSNIRFSEILIRNKDKRVILELLQHVPGSLKYVNDIKIILELFNDPTFIQYIQRNNVQFSELLIDSKKEKKHILELVHRVPEQLKYVGDIKIILELFDDLYFMQCVKESNFNFRFSKLLVDQIDLKIFESIGIYLIKDTEFIRKLIFHINDFYYTRNQNVEEFKSKIQLALLILQHDGLFLKETTLNLNKMENIVLEAVKQNGLALEFADSKFKENKEIVMISVRNNGMSLQFADFKFRENKEIVMIAVKNNGMSLEFASKSLKKDPLIVLEAIKQNVNSFKFCDYHYTICDNEEIYKELFQKNYNPLVISPKIRKNREIMLIAITGNATNFNRVDDSLKQKPFILEAIQQNGMILEFLDDDYKKDFYCVQRAIKQNGMSLKFANEDLRKNKELIKEAALQNGEVLKYLGDVLDKEIVIEIVQQNGMLLKFLSDNYRENPEIVIEAVKQTKDAEKFMKLVPSYIYFAIENGISYEEAKQQIAEKEFRLDTFGDFDNFIK